MQKQIGIIAYRDKQTSEFKSSQPLYAELQSEGLNELALYSLCALLERHTNKINQIRRFQKNEVKRDYSEEEYKTKRPSTSTRN